MQAQHDVAAARPLTRARSQFMIKFSTNSYAANSDALYMYVLIHYMYIHTYDKEFWRKNAYARKSVFELFFVDMSAKTLQVAPG